MNFISHFENCKVKSNYHFDDKIIDHRGEWFTVGGKLTNTWQEDLASIKSNLFPMNWANIRSTINGGTVNPNLEYQEYDISFGGGNPKMTLVDVNDKLEQYTELFKIVNSFGLDDPRGRIHVQKTGQVFNYHIDTLDLLFPGIPEDKLIRITVMLEDWRPGHFYMYGTCIYDRWEAGEYHWFKWRDVPHATANASSYPRCSLVITGIRTDATDNILKNDNTYTS